MSQLEANAAMSGEQLAALWAEAWPMGMPRDPIYPCGPVPLTGYLRAWARETPGKNAIIFYGREITYRELDELSDRFANLLLQRGVVKGDRVSVMMSNCPQFHIAFFGILKCGAVYAPVSPLSTSFELGYQLEDSGAVVLITTDALMPVVRNTSCASALKAVFATRLADFLPPHPVLEVPRMLNSANLDCSGAEDFLPALESAAATPPSVQLGLDDLAALNYTGGTTGLPKGCAHTHGDMVYTAAASYHVAGHGSADLVSLNFFPEFWIAGENNGLIFPVFAGCTLVLLSRWDPLAFMQAVDRYKVNTVVLQMDGAVEVMEHPKVSQFDLRSLSHVRAVSFVKKLNMEYRRQWRALTGATLISGPYGMTETHTGNTFTLGMQADDFDLRSTPIFVGLPVPGADFRIRDFDSGSVLGLGQEGEICVRTPAMMKSYWNAPEAFAAVVQDGWLRTGDIGMIDNQGFIHYLGRRKEMLKVKGMSVFPSEIEAVLARHPAVAACAVIGMADEVLGQEPIAFVVLDAAHASCDEVVSTLDEWCNQTLAVYKRPRIRLLEEMPLTGTGKIRKDALAKLL